MVAAAKARGLSSVWLVYSPETNLAAVVYATNHVGGADTSGPDFATLSAIQSAPSLAAVVAQQDWVKNQDLTQFIWGVWFKFLPGDHGSTFAGGVRVAADELGVYADNRADSFLAQWEQHPLNDGGFAIGVKIIQHGAGAVLATTTDADGRFVLRGTGDERVVTLRLSGGGIADEELRVVNRPGFDPRPANEDLVDSLAERL